MRKEDKKVIFTFEEEPDTEQDVLDFYNRQALVDPLTFAESMRNLKGIIYQRKL